MQTSSVRPVWKVILARGISIVVMGLLVFGVCTGESNQRPKFELTETDITAIKNFRADQITVYGVSLGMTRNEAESLLRANQGIIVEQDRPNPTRLYVYDKTPDGFKNRCILYYIWWPNNPGLARLTVFGDCAKHLKGITKHLLSSAALDPQSYVRRVFLGSPSRARTTLDIPMATHVTYYYEEKWLEITHQRSVEGEGVVFALVRQRPTEAGTRPELGEYGERVLAEDVVTRFMEEMSTGSFRRRFTLMPYLSKAYFDSRWLDADIFNVNSCLTKGDTFRVVQVELPYVDVEVTKPSTAGEQVKHIRFKVITERDKFVLFPSRAEETEYGNWVDPWWASTGELFTDEDFDRMVQLLKEELPDEKGTTPEPFVFENVTVWKVFDRDTGTTLGTELKGEVTNQSGASYERGAAFQVTLYGRGGGVVGSGSFSLFGLRDGQTRPFKVTIDGTDPDDVFDWRIEFDRGD